MRERTYISRITCRAPLPRSKRLREAGAGGGGSSTTVVFSGAQGATVVAGSQHSHSNLNILEQITTDNNGYMWLTQLREFLEGGLTVNRNVTEKVKAGYADMAHDLDPDSPVRDEFLSRVHDDSAQGKIDFLQGLDSHQLSKFLSGVHFGDFTSGLWSGTGGAVDSRGNAEFESLRVRTVMEVMELVVNRLSAIEGDQLLTESDIIESVDALGDGRFGLHLQRKYEGYFTALTENAVIKGMVNNIYDAAVSGVPLVYYTSWMRVNMVNTITNYIEVSTYPHDQVPSGRNFIPCPLMRIARWGHQTDETRQTCILLSTTERRIIFYQHVTKPIIDPKINIGMCLGRVPEFLEGGVHQIDPNQNYLYVKGVFTEGVHTVPINGEPVYEYTIEGPWERGRTYYYKDFNPDRGRYEINSVYHIGCQWQCMRTGTQQEPAYSSPDWAMTVGNKDFRIEFVEPEHVFELNHFDTTLTIRAWVGWLDVTDDLLDDNVGWTRYTECSDGVQRVDSDNIWTIQRGGSGKQLHLTREDLDIHSDGMPTKIIFTAVAQLTDGVTAAAQFIY